MSETVTHYSFEVVKLSVEDVVRGRLVDLPLDHFDITDDDLLPFARVKATQILRCRSAAALAVLGTGPLGVAEIYGWYLLTFTHATLDL